MMLFNCSSIFYNLKNNKKIINNIIKFSAEKKKNNGDDVYPRKVRLS